eukprot:189231-Prorocentrum_minimum.AAC.1
MTSVHLRPVARFRQLSGVLLEAAPSDGDVPGLIGGQVHARVAVRHVDGPSAAVHAIAPEVALLQRHLKA